MSSRLSLVLCALLLAISAGAAEAAKKKKKVKKDEYEEHKYKSYRVLTDEPKTYRFDANGNPIPVEQPKKKKKKKKLSSEEADAACEENADSCAPKPADGEPQP